MKIWILVWYLVYPPIDGETTVVYGHEEDLTSGQCFELVAAKDAEYRDLQMGGEVVDFKVYCKKEE